MNALAHSPTSSKDEHALRLAPLAAVIPALLSKLGEPPAGARLLDLGCGIGEPALTAAHSWPHVVGCDQDEQALEIARGRAGAEHLDNIELRQASFENLGLADASFEAAISRFGVLMFGDRHAGGRELARVLAPGAPYALALWSAPNDNPYLRLGLRTVERVLGSLEGLPDFAAHFSELGSTPTVLSWLTDAGMTNAGSDWFDWDAEFPGIESACDYLMTAGGPLAGFYAALSDEQRKEACTVQAELVAAEQVSGSGVVLRSRCRIVSGSR